MRERKRDEAFEGKRLLNIEEACRYVSMGRNNTRAWCEEIGALRRFGKSVRFDRAVIDGALDALPSAAAVVEN